MLMSRSVSTINERGTRPGAEKHTWKDRKRVNRERNIVTSL